MMLLAALIAAQGMDHGHMPGMAMPPPAPAHQHGDMDHGHGTSPDMAPGDAGPAAATGTDLPAGDAPAPPPPADHYADRDWDPAAMARARATMMREEGGRRFHQVFFNLAEVQVRSGRDGYRWDGEGWFGGDVNRLVVKTEGEGAIRGRIDTAEVQALYSRAIGPYYNLQAGIRRDVRPGRTYAAAGLEGLAPGWFETEAALFLSDRGDLLARLEGWVDQRVTQRLVLQPRVELNLAARDVARDRVGRGLIDAELGLRLRYEIAREFAPYVGVSWERKTGRTAAYARANLEDTGGAAAVFGVRAWF